VPDHMEADMRLMSLDIARSSSETVEVAVPEAGNVAWRFACESYDVNFSADFLPQGKDATPLELHAVERKEAEDGIFDAPGPGTVRLTFDNGFSWTRGKTVKYDVMFVAATEGQGSATPKPEEEG